MSSKNSYEYSTKQLSRWQFLAQSSSFLVGILPCNAFEGGVGGLGKTKPDTGVVFYGESAPLQNSKGIISTELNVEGNPILVEFTTPWPLLPTQPVDCRGTRFAIIRISIYSSPFLFSGDEKQFPKIVLESILGSKEKFGAYGARTDVKITKRWRRICI
jgi:hypothetical protein